MSALDQIYEFIINNWESIIIALFFGFLFLILSSIALSRYLISAKRERQKQAKNDLIQIIEDHIINKRKIELIKINQLMNAVEEKHSIILDNYITPITLLEDVYLRIEESRHLPMKKKKEHASIMRETINKIKDEIKKEETPKKIQELMDLLEKDIKDKKTDKALDDLKLLSKKIKKEPMEIKYEELLPEKIIPFLKLALFLNIKFRAFQEKHPKAAILLEVAFIVTYLIFFIWLVTIQNSS